MYPSGFQRQRKLRCPCGKLFQRDLRIGEISASCRRSLDHLKSRFSLGQHLLRFVVDRPDLIVVGGQFGEEPLCVLRFERSQLLFASLYRLKLLSRRLYDPRCRQPRRQRFPVSIFDQGISGLQRLQRTLLRRL
ncbi:MAG TPA: hypothetical protein PLK77_03395 [Pyrinomonadaceae bacterium]|nr:hypothetical protein [Pyrinomonadaceae bacterium]